jgi:hypothetical protein
VNANAGCAVLLLAVPLDRENDPGFVVTQAGPVRFEDRCGAVRCLEHARYGLDRAGAYLGGNGFQA